MLQNRDTPTDPTTPPAPAPRASGSAGALAGAAGATFRLTDASRSDGCRIKWQFNGQGGRPAVAIAREPPPTTLCRGFRSLLVGHGLDARVRSRQLRAGRRALP